MSNFILISLSDRLHPIVDGILGCCPRDGSAPTCIFTGKIVHQGASYMYEWSTTASAPTTGDAQGLAALLKNQLAQFRRTCGMQPTDMANIFLLDNPMTEDELSLSEMWISEFDTLYKQGIRNFRLHRVLLAYDVANPASVSACTDGSILDQIIRQNEERATDLNSITYPTLLFLLTNQDCAETAICESKTDHDLMMKRFLADFMMLASNQNDSYNVYGSIVAQPPTNCFSAGYAEYMYYYPDVERYFDIACKRDLYRKCLNAPDRTQDVEDEEAMDVDAHPFGLRERKQRLSKIYEDVPYDQRIDLRPDSADKEIHDHIVTLKETIEAEYAQEEDTFNAARAGKEQEVESNEQAYTNASTLENETDDDFQARKGQLKAQWEESKRELEAMTFSPKCPGYIDRKVIYLNQHSCTARDDEHKYEQLIAYVTTNEFRQFTLAYKPQAEDTPLPDPPIGNAGNDELENRKGCMLWLFFWKKNNEDKLQEEKSEELPTSQPPEAPDPKESIMRIAELMKLKRTFKGFEDKIDNIQRREASRSMECKKFTLTHHSKSIPLIDISKLGAEHSSKSEGLMASSILQWENADERSLESLVTTLAQRSSDYTKANYSKLDWSQPFSFIMSSGSQVLEACNSLQRKSNPFVNYNTYQAEGSTNAITILYSDDKNFGTKFLEMKNSGNLQNASAITAQTSAHTVSKIAIMNYLPLSQNLLKSLRSAQPDMPLGSAHTAEEAEAPEPCEPPIDWGDY